MKEPKMLYVIVLVTLYGRALYRVLSVVHKQRIFYWIIQLCFNLLWWEVTGCAVQYTQGILFQWVYFLRFDMKLCGKGLPWSFSENLIVVSLYLFSQVGTIIRTVIMPLNSFTGFSISQRSRTKCRWVNCKTGQLHFGSVAKLALRCVRNFETCKTGHLQQHCLLWNSRGRSGASSTPIKHRVFLFQWRQREQ